MFDIAFSEIALVILVSFLLFGAKDTLEIIKSLKRVISNIKDQYNSFIEHLHKELDEEELVHIVFDDDGNPHQAYNLEKLTPFLNKKSAKKDEKRKD
ncbi:MAG: twin-arginine translocase TatA/TatE family subunit [Alphaproteobacteria bacterium]|jgi:Sec-independent protein translocase protein TatA|nr:twin-arginine translocase TatA/TatE family subunit [Candidatus Jidaibacter sp.]